MLLEEGLFRKLQSDTTLVGLLGTRMHPGRLPQTPTYPALVYKRVSGVRVRHLRGPAGLAHARLQLDVYAATYAQGKAVADRIRVVLDDLAADYGSVVVQGAFLLMEQDVFEEAVDKHRVILDYEVWYQEA